MSFWFIKRGAAETKKRAAGGPSGRGATPVARQSISTLWRLGCRACPLDRAKCYAPKMEPLLANRPSVYFMGQSPGRDEDEHSGKPFTGPPGRLLRELIPSEYQRNCCYDNVLNCRPPDDRSATWVEMEACRPRHIAAIEESKPRLIVGLGSDALTWALGSADMVGLRGRLFAIKVGQHSCWFMPTYDPAFILKTAIHRDRPLNSMYGHCLKMDIRRAFEALEWLQPPVIDDPADITSGIVTFTGVEPGAAKEVLAFLRRALREKLVVIDVETKGLRPYSIGAKVLSCSVTVDGTTVAWAIDHPGGGFTKNDRLSILKALAELLTSKVVKVAHNVPFEVEWFAWLLGETSIVHKTWRCTMSQAQFVDERKGKHRSDDNDPTPIRYQGLGFLCKQHFGVDPKVPFKFNKAEMDKVPLSDLLPYNGVDTKYTERLYWHQLEILEATGRAKAYRGCQGLQPTVALMQRIGVGVDQSLIKQFQKKLDDEIDPIRDAIFGDAAVKSFIKKQREFNPDSSRDVLTLFRDYLKCLEVFVQDKHGKDRESVDKNILDKIKHPLAKHIVDYRHLTKLKSTYIDGLELGKGEIIYPDGRLHTNFNTTIAETARLTSDGPNLQNYPKRNDAWVRKPVIPKKNHVFVAIDYGQLEACTGAMCSQDKFLVKALWEDYDIHMEWAERTAHAEPELIGGKAGLKDPVVMKKFRGLIKNKLVFPAIFGAAPQSVRGYLHNATGFDVDQGVIDQLMNDFWGCFSGIQKWQDRTMKRYYNEGHVDTLRGHRRHYPLTRNQAINHPIQGTAAELVCDAMERMSRLSLSEGIDHLHPVLNVHDDLTFMIPDSDAIIEDSLNIIMEQMLTFDFSWVNVPISIEVSIGHNWCDVKEIGKFWSHREFGYPYER